VTLDFPLWLRATHFFNLLFLSLLMRSGLEILSAHPKFYWNDDCTPGSEWLSFSRRRPPDNQLRTASDEEASWSSWIALPGHGNLGLGRHWHFLADAAWLATGLAYLVMLVATAEWRRLIPTSWEIAPAAWHTLLSYATLQVVETPGAYNPLQQLSYAGVVFLLAPLSIVTGIAMSPAIAARFPRYLQIFHGRQSARSIHFLCLCAFALFTVAHVTMVALHGFQSQWALIVLGQTQTSDLDRAMLVGLTGIAVIVVIHVMATRCSRRRPRVVQRLTEAIIDPLRRRLFGRVLSAQAYAPADISAFFWVNGRPPAEEAYLALARDQFADYRLEVGGLVETPLHLSLTDLRAMPKQTQVTKHCCIQGWSGVAEWGGVSLQRILDLCRPLPSARFILFRAYDNISTSEPHGHGPGYFYGTIGIELANDPQTMLAYEMNGEQLPIPHGAPLRLRVESQLGFTMVKYIRSIELIDGYRDLGEGQGGWREDYQYFSQEAGI
jgi:DMSO/TMAO reductase YedYZ molybdopterin-dependent catalytic subunit/thiosulfate reductase cytochrome b subunit